MAKNHGSSVKDDKLCEELREDGASKEKAARIANAKAGGENVSKKGGQSGSYEDWTAGGRQARAREPGSEGRSTMTRAGLARALRTHWPRDRRYLRRHRGCHVQAVRSRA